MIKKPFTIQFPQNPVSGFSWDIATSNGLQVRGTGSSLKPRERLSAGVPCMGYSGNMPGQSKDYGYIPEG